LWVQFQRGGGVAGVAAGQLGDDAQIERAQVLATAALDIQVVSQVPVPQAAPADTAAFR
jgi:hypothetical protein